MGRSNHDSMFVTAPRRRSAAALTRIGAWLAAAALALAGCGGSSSGGSSSSSGGEGNGAVAKGEGGKAIKTGGGGTVNLEAHNRWKEGVAAFKSAEKSGWNDQRCDDVASKFEDAASAQNKFAEALYMAGAARTRCRSAAPHPGRG